MTPLFVDWLVILGVAVCCHALLLVNPGRYWDSWFLSSWQVRRGDHLIKRFYSEVGMPAWYHLHRFMGRLPHFLYWYNALIFLSLIANPLLVFEICRHSIFLSTDESLLIACLAAALPLPQMVVDYIVGTHYNCTLTLFYLAWLLVMPTMPTHGVVLLQTAACVLFLVSFNMNSLLVFFGWFYGIDFLIQFQLDGVWTLPYLVHYLVGTWYLIILPPLFWFWKRTFTPTSGPYATYNTIKLPKLRLLLKKLWGVYTVSLFEIPVDAVRYAVTGSLISSLLATATVGLLYWSPWNPAHVILVSSRHDLILVGVGLLGLFMAGAPYVIVGLTFGPWGWETKNNTVLPAPAACVLAGLFILVCQPPWLPDVVCVVLVIFAVYWNYHYLRWFAISAKYDAILDQLGQVPDILSYSVISLNDRHFISAGSPGHSEHGNGCSVASFMLSFLNHGRPFCISFPDLGERLLNAEGARYSDETVRKIVNQSPLNYDLAHIDPAGRQAVAVIEDQRRHKFESTGFRYLVLHLFAPKRLSSFYAKLIRLNFVPLPRGPGG